MLHRQLFKNRAICANAALIAMFVTSGAAAGGGGSDDCANAQQIAGAGAFAFDNSTATTDGLPDPSCNFFGQDQIDHDVWFCWTASVTGEVMVDTCGQTGVDTKIAVYDGCTCPTGNGLLACNDDACSLQSQITFMAVQGQQYLLRIGTFPGASGGTGTFNIQEFGGGGGGGSDDCANAEQIAGDGVFSFDNSTATTDGLPHAACNFFGQDQITNDVWFCWTASITGEVTVETCGLTTIDSKIAAYDGCTCPEGNGLLACNDDACSLQSRITFNAVKGQQYLLRIGNFPGASGGTGTFNIQTFPANNDDCANAQQIAGDGVFRFDNSTATTDGLPHAACKAFGQDQINNDVWFCWTASITGEVTVATCGLTLVDTKIAAYDGCTCPEGNGLLACNDDACSLQSRITFNAVKGQQYLLRIGTFPGAAGGTGSFNIQTFEPPCPADFDDSGDVGVKDLLFLLGAWGPCPEKGACPADFDGSGDVGVKDLLFLLGAWGPCPGPPQLVYSHEFVNGVTYCPGNPQYDDWLSFRASIPTSGVTSITLSGSQDPTGRTCSDPVVAQQIADAMRTLTTLTVECGGNTWRVNGGGGCQVGCALPDNDLVLSVGGGFCSCDATYLIRPGIGNENWGGITVGSCGSPTQTMTVTIE